MEAPWRIQRGSVKRRISSHGFADDERPPRVCALALFVIRCAQYVIARLAPYSRDDAQHGPYMRIADTFSCCADLGRHIERPRFQRLHAEHAARQADADDQSGQQQADTAAQRVMIRMGGDEHGKAP